MNNKVIIKSLIWKFIERCGVQLSTFVVTVILARLLDPQEYGILSILNIFIVISQVFVQAGLGTALIQKKDIDSNSYSGVFYVSILISFVVYIFLFLFSPIFAIFFNIPKIKCTLRILAIILPIGSLSIVLDAMLIKQMNFSKLFICNILSSIISGIIGIIMAYYDYGVWALIIQQISLNIIGCIFKEIFLHWRPVGLSSIKLVGDLIQYGYKIMIANLISTGYNELRSILIGRKFDSSDLAYNDRGKQIPNVIITNIDYSINTVMLPVYSSSNDNIKRLKQMLRRSMKTSSFIIFPILMGLCIIARPLVTIIYTEKWLPSVPYLIIYAVIYGLAPLQTANAQAINAMGRSDIFLKLEILKKSIGMCILLITFFFCNKAIEIVFSGVIIAIMSSIINMYPNTYLLKYSYVEQIKDISGSLFLSIIMGVCIWSISFFIKNMILLLVIQIASGMLIYIILSILTKNENFFYLYKTIKHIIEIKK